ncbi:DUF1896 family protein [Maribellus maritimus]|uniref:DUF1896 family protein n=1 Tax=Maribellus maritimus TaxID=2870838 RepID=UPI001EEC0960|nr:DUF1896 family protein [Maribellus maritimus]MCG6191554.1 DUF1896 domain-containing protein [Maribellus maritimus]
MNNSYQELSWFKLSLLHFLYESHPELIDNNNLLNTRSDLASKTYSESIKNGHTQQEAEELATKDLYHGLHFSKHDTLVTILWNEFPREIPMGQAKEFAIKLLPKVEGIFSKYKLNDEFAFSPEFHGLYVELTGELSIWVGEHGLQ